MRRLHRDLRQLQRHGNKSANDALSLRDVDEIDVFLPIDSLKTLRYLDTPGLGDPDQDAALTEDAIRQCDALIWCTPANQAWKATEKAFWAGVPESVRLRSILVITRADQLNSDADRQSVLRRVRADAGKLFGAVVMVGLSPREQHGTEELRSAIDEVVVKHAPALRQEWAVRKAGEVIAAAIGGREAELAEVEAISATVQKFDQDVMKAWAKCAKALERAARKASRDLSGLNKRAADLAKTIIIKEKHYEPEEEGIIFTKVAWKKINYETLDPERIADVHDALHDKLMSVETALCDAVDAAGDSLLAAIVTASDDMEGELHRFADAIAWHVRARLAGLSEQVAAPFWLAIGSLRGGYWGFYAFRARIFFGQGKSLSTAILKEAAAEWFAFDWAADHTDKEADAFVANFTEELRELVDELHGFVAGIVASINNEIHSLHRIGAIVRS